MQVAYTPDYHPNNASYSKADIGNFKISALYLMKDPLLAVTLKKKRF